MARAAVKFPIVLDMIRTQRVTLTSLALVAPHLVVENHEALLQKVCGASKRETEKIIAHFSTSKPKRDVIRPVVINVPHAPRTGEVLPENWDCADFASETLVLNSVTANEGKADKVRISFDAPAALAEKIERLKEIHAHKLKDGSLAEVLEMAVDMLLDKTAPERKSEPRTKAQKKVDSSTQSSGVQMAAHRPPAGIQREVRKRDGGRCAFTDHEGRRCSAKSRLQIDHVRPWALGGTSRDPVNLRLLCQAHNLHAAEKYFPAKLKQIRATSRNN